jgi:hypothetical protein
MRIGRFILLAVAIAPLGSFGAAFAEDVATEPVLERPTLRCLGVYWIVPDAKNATIELDYRKAGDADWQHAMPLFRVEAGKHKSEKFGSKLEIPDGGTLFAGSIVNLQSETAYEMRPMLKKNGAPALMKALSARTRSEPSAMTDAPIRHVIPADRDQSGGSGSEADPFRGIAAAQVAARPGDVFLLHAGTYIGTFEVTRSGERDQPIVWRGIAQRDVILDARAAAEKRPPRAIAASGVHDVYFENLTIQNADYGVVAHDSARIVMRHCHIHYCDFGLAATRNTRDAVRDFFIADNVIEGPCTWPRTKGIENPRGIQLTGAGHVVCYNRIGGFSDAIDTYNSPRCESIDFHNNDIGPCTDDGIELDYSQRNVRCFENRLTNCFQGISVQPVFGGPVYAFRNALYNIEREPFKMHNSPSGAIFYHNTVVKKGPPMLLYTNEAASNLVMRNNLFVGTDGDYAWQCSPKMTNCDFDYDGFSNGNYQLFLKWNGRRYATFEEMKSKAPIERHASLVAADLLFASGARPPDDPKKEQPPPDLRPVSGSSAVDAGQPLPNFNDGYAGAAPDLGAYEQGQPLPHYGPRDEKR